MICAIRAACKGSLLWFRYVERGLAGMKISASVLKNYGSFCVLRREVKELIG